MAGKVEPIEFPRKRRDGQVVAWENTSLFSSKDFPRYNPDLLVQRHGLGVYKKMLIDEQVKAAFTFKRDAITSRDWVLQWPADVKLADTEKKRRQGMLERMLRKMRGSLTDKMNHILSGMAYGYSLTEKIYGTFDYEGRPESGIVDLLPKDPATFWFYTDDYGVLEDVRQKVAGREQSVELHKFVHYVHAPEEDEYYGESDLRGSYRAWYSKDVTWKYWVLWAERLAGGLVVANRTPDSNITPGTPEFEELKDVIKNIKTVGGLILPPGVELEVHHPPTTDGFEKMITFQDLAIAKGMLVPNLLGISHNSGAGSLAQSQTHLEAFFWTLNATAQRLAACITEHVIKDAAYRLFPDELCPEFTFKPASMEQVKWIVETWTKLVSGGAVTSMPVDEEHLRKLLEMPEVSAEDIEAERQKALDHELELKATGPAVAEGEAPPAATSAPPAKKATYSRKQAAEGRVAFSVIGNRAEDIAQQGVTELAQLTAKAVERLIEPARVAEYVKDPKLIETVQFESSDLTKINRASKRTLEAAWKLGSRHAADEMSMARKSAFKADFRRLGELSADYFEATGFRMARDLSDGARKAIQQELQNGVKFDRSAAEIRTAIYEALIRRGYTTLDATRGASIEDINTSLTQALAEAQAASNAAYLNTLVRTNTFEAINESRYSLFTDPEIGDFVRALEYSSVLDSNTTEFCVAMHGRVYSKDSPVWTEGGYRPPNHFNCRGTLIAITAIDEWDGVESDPPPVEPAQGFA